MPGISPKDVPTREAIQIARVLCILGIVYVHAWTGLTGEQLAAIDQTPQGILRWPLTSARAEDVLAETRTLLASLTATTGTPL